ncbi:MAG: tRNA uridine-5-carboxymethylaminomethyl(34) synthesis GTPase MnmE [Azonexus sp.]|uniref:tRNA uridine-5-carboxymethylaminomethyl(34) synthesis GTPase MnmE n=1 Tax=Azonexus sp. TaxID=1872668 RepID=UPI00282043E0|nr:tRNA uridine-5-carboxymethylaminomethyl(34) synthesis GTPase MnmE [Azonexus sp.]MDR0776229.1 tRNA uridine-5-carboxymethylaminomethyl(34) synthesis GTPase MnmE [Azonexus sp.]
MNTDTIAAIATAPGRGGVGVIRISGSALLPFALALCGKTPKPRYATLAEFRAADGSAIDSGLLLYFPNPHSFTGEDVLELQGHGGPVVLQMLLARCLDLGARLAEPGEFSRRAFLNGKMDLAQAEAVADLIDAATASAARSAVRSLQGEFSRAIHGLTEELINLRMLVEATLDFPEEDIDFLKAADAFGRLERLQFKLAEVFDRAGQGRLLQAGLHVVLAGQPNVGKSSLLNRLAGDELAIVTAIAGTTRDALRSTIQIEGIPLHIIDTAGLRDTDDEIERIGIERSWQEIARAGALLLLVDARSGITDADREILARLPAKLPRITVYNKIDLADRQPERHAEHDAHGDAVAISLSAKANQGIDLLRAELLRIAGWHPAEDVFIARERHLRALTTAQEHIAAARAVVEGPLPALELFAEELRLAQQALGEITGEFTADDLLGVIFSRFCIGK